VKNCIFTTKIYENNKAHDQDISYELYGPSLWMVYSKEMIQQSLTDI